tara:strand:+ start:1252 stop:1812 length:561 start_codon:yes stop_codon:yes gene_type:complete
MRIISGKLRGKNIFFLKSSTTRPLKDSVKENIFNIISHSKLLNLRLEKSNILDLYSGFGSFGLECISRGAEKITFVEKNNDIAKILKKNLSNLNIVKNVNLVVDSAKNFLTKNFSNKYEIIFLDPPFTDDSYIEDLKIIKQKKNFKKNHVVIIHREIKSFEDFNKILDPILVKKYGRSKIIFGRFL